MEIKIVMIRKFNSKKLINILSKIKPCSKLIKGRDTQLKTTEPIAPEYVLLGLILESFFPLKILPKI